MPTARTNKPTKTNRPTRSSVHVNCLRIGIDAVPPPDKLPGSWIQLQVRATHRYCQPQTLTATTERQSTASSHKIALEIRVLCRSYLLGSAIEIDPPFVVDDKSSDRLIEISLNAR